MQRRESVLSVGSILLAFLASQHHTLHMLLMALGAGGASMSFMAMFPMVRRAMLILALLMIGWTIRQLYRQQQPKAMRLMGSLSAVVSLALVAWSVYQFGI